MSKITSQADLKKGLRIIDEELAPSSHGRVSDSGMHIPDLGLIDAKNTLPTNNGYISFFGATDKLESTPLIADVQEQLTYKTLYGDIIQIAFCAEGLWIRSLAGDAIGTLTEVFPAGTRVESINSMPTSPGSGYMTGDVLTITGGTIPAKVLVTKIFSFISLTLLSGGEGYTVGSGITTTGGSGTGLTVEVLVTSSNTRDYTTLDFNDGKCAWTKVATTVPSNPWKLWTYAIMENRLYVYQKGLRAIGIIGATKTGQVRIDYQVPTYINANQKVHTFVIEHNNFTDIILGATPQDKAVINPASYRSIQFTTASGLDFGVQIAPINTMEEARAHEAALVAALEDTGLFSVTSVNTYTIVPPLQGYIQAVTASSPADFALVAAAMAGTTHDGIAADLNFNLSVDQKTIWVNGIADVRSVSWIAYGGNTVTILPLDTLNEVIEKLLALYMLDPALVAIGIGDPLSWHYPQAAPWYGSKATLTVSFTLAEAEVAICTLGSSLVDPLYTVNYNTEDIVPMGHVDGIMSGRSRLGAWDADDLIYWSSGTDFLDFTPSAGSGANQVSVSSLKGKIIKCEGFTQGFVIYATGNAIVATFAKSATSMYNFKPIDESEGATDPRHIAVSKDIHYYWSSKGLIKLLPGAHKIELIAKEFTDWIKTYRYPIQIQLLSNRFLVIYLQDTGRRFSNRDVRNGGTEVTSAAVHAPTVPISFTFRDPGLNLYPTYSRVLIYDTLLTKWGSCDIDCKLLVSLTPYNQGGYQLSKNYQLLDASLDSAQRELAIRLPDNFTYMATTYPADSYVLFGHYAAHRYKDTKLVEVDTEYVDYPNTTIEIEQSFDRAKIDFTANVSAPQTKLAQSQGFNIAASWFNVLIKGHYHLKRMLVKGYKYGR